MISPLSLTHKNYSDTLRQLVGKGATHAGLLYSEFWRTGGVIGDHPAFNNAPELREQLMAHSLFRAPEVVDVLQDGATRKFLTCTHDGLEVESVIIPMRAGPTLCVSSQVGCRLGCAFCETGRMGLLRNLTVAEITAQLWAARHLLDVSVRSVVFMGMGEPFDNYENVISAVRVMVDPKGGGLGPRHVTVSTSGVLEGIERLLQERDLPINLAISLNAASDEVRRGLMPIHRQHDLAAIYSAIACFNQQTGREVLVAYVLLKGVNDRLVDADRLAAFLTGVKVKVNLIPYNAQSRDRFARPDDVVVRQFKQRLRDRGLLVLSRDTKGDSIMAACGQLGNLELRRKVCRRG